MFRNLASGKWAEWNSNDVAAQRSLSNEALTKYGASERLLDYAKKKFNADYLYGGYAEDRSVTLKGTYLEPDTFLHLGMDVFVPAKTQVMLDYDAELVQVYCDTPEECGWGTRLLFKLNDFSDTHLLYGHLAPGLTQADIGTKFKDSSVVGELGDREENGGWSPHLHIQAISGDISEFIDKPELLDGYGKLSEKETLLKRFPNPARFFILGSFND